MVLNFSVGVSVGFGDQQRTLWIGCALWGERGEKLAPYLTKGKPIAVTGDVDLRTYETRDGKSGAEITLNVQRVTLLGKGEAKGPASAPANPPAQKAARDDFDDQIPF